MQIKGIADAFGVAVGGCPDRATLPLVECDAPLGHERVELGVVFVGFAVFAAVGAVGDFGVQSVGHCPIECVVVHLR